MVGVAARSYHFVISVAAAIMIVFSAAAVVVDVVAAVGSSSLDHMRGAVEVPGAFLFIKPLVPPLAYDAAEPIRTARLGIARLGVATKLSELPGRQALVSRACHVQTWVGSQNKGDG